MPQTPKEELFLLREQIATEAGDTLSLLGTTNDTAMLALHGLASLATALSTATSLAQVRAAAEPFAAQAADFLANVEAGTVRLPYIAKGVNGTMAEIETRATAVSEALVPTE